MPLPPLQKRLTARGRVLTAITSLNQSLPSLHSIAHPEQDRAAQMTGPCSIHEVAAASLTWTPFDTKCANIHILTIDPGHQRAANRHRTIQLPSQPGPSADRLPLPLLQMGAGHRQAASTGPVRPRHRCPPRV